MQAGCSGTRTGWFAVTGRSRTWPRAICSCAAQDGSFCQLLRSRYTGQLDARVSRHREAWREIHLIPACQRPTVEQVSDGDFDGPFAS